MAQKHALGVRLFGSEDVIQDSRQLVSGCCHGFRCTQLSAHPAEELLQIVVGVIETLRNSRLSKESSA